MEGSFGAGYLNGSDRTVGHPGVVPVIETKRYIPVKEDGYNNEGGTALIALHM